METPQPYGILMVFVNLKSFYIFCLYACLSLIHTRVLLMVIPLKKMQFIDRKKNTCMRNLKNDMTILKFSCSPSTGSQNTTQRMGTHANNTPWSPTSCDIRNMLMLMKFFCCTFVLLLHHLWRHLGGHANCTIFCTICCKSQAITHHFCTIPGEGPGTKI